MDFRRKTRPRVVFKPEYESLEQRYPHNVMLYKLPPIEDLKIAEFEELALERLRLLRILEQASNKTFRFLSDEWKEYVNAEMTREGLKGYQRLCSGTTSTANAAKREAVLQARRRDHISHFILRLVHCRTEEQMRWFLLREMELFKYKFSALSSADIKHFLDLNQLEYVPLTEAQKDAVKDGLYESTAGQSVAKIELLDFYKVHFTQVLDLVHSRRCYLKCGYAYVNSHDFVSIVAVKQQDEIEHGLQSARRLIGDVETDERLHYLLKSLHSSYTGKDYALNKDANHVPIESLDQLAKKSYPLCMRACHEHLRVNNHMKHGGRMQYGLFLKGIGVTLEDSIRFWREEFTKRMDQDTFSKRYEYNIQHNYGKRGSMVNYSPYSCMKIIQDSLTQGDMHGCPYKLFDTATLRAKLTANGLSAAHVQEVLSYSTKGHYQLACSKYFQITHGDAVGADAAEVAITHPNQYFDESQQLLGNRAKKKSTPAHRAVKRNANNTNTTVTGTMSSDDDEELWNVAETQEKMAAWDEDLDLTAVQY